MANSRNGSVQGRKRGGASPTEEETLIVPEKIRAVMEHHLEHQILDGLRTALECRRDIFVFELVERVVQATAAHPSQGVTGRTQIGTSEWIPIESLSALRAVVGGRFQQLKQRWIEAGLPLREHRGDRSGEAEFNEKGWAELTNWVLKQGYEARRTGREEGHLFELREAKKRRG